MKYVTKIILIMTCLIIMLPFGGCVRKKQVTAQKAGVLKPEAPGKEVLDHGEAVVDISNVAQGYVALRYKGSVKKISVEVHILGKPLFSSLQDKAFHTFQVLRGSLLISPCLLSGHLHLP